MEADGQSQPSIHQVSYVTAGKKLGFDIFQFFESPDQIYVANTKLLRLAWEILLQHLSCQGNNNLTPCRKQLDLNYDLSQVKVLAWNKKVCCLLIQVVIKCIDLVKAQQY